MLSGKSLSPVPALRNILLSLIIFGTWKLWVFKFLTEFTVNKPHNILVCDLLVGKNSILRAIKMKTCNVTNNRSPLTISSPVIWSKGKVNLPIPRIPVKRQITLLHLGLCPIGKGALVVTGGPVGTGADGRFRRLEVGLCIVWLAFAVTVSLLSPPLRRSSPCSSSYLRVRLRFSPFLSRNFNQLQIFCK